MKPDEFQIVTQRPQGRAVVVAVLRSQEDEDESLLEIRELLRTAGVTVAGTISQRRGNVHPRTFVGSGKLQEVQQLVEHLDPDIVVIDDELSPSQQRTLEDVLQRRVLDRTAVILDIFALHAHTAEGKLQVELAQLEYNLSRMRGLWMHLERLGGGIGSRGPGESQLETDRRLARNRIALLRKRMRHLETQRETMRKQRRRSVTPTVSLAGYTNAGKSTLLNALTGSKVSVENRLFETLDPTTRSYEQAGRRYLITDTVGFIERLPHELVDAFRSTLEETLSSDLVLLVADGSLSDQRLARQEEAVRDVLAEIGAADIPLLMVLNKVDQLDERERELLARRYPDAVLVSAKTGEGLETLTERVALHFAERFARVDLLIPYEEAGVLQQLYAAGAPVERTDSEDGIRAVAYLPKQMLSQVEQYQVEQDPPQVEQGV